MSRILYTWYERRKLLFGIVAGLIALYALAGFVAAPLMVRHLLDTRLSDALHRRVRTERVRINPFTFSMRVTGLSISERNGSPFARISTLSVNLDPLLSLFKWGVVIQSIRINGPQANLIRTANRQFNFTDLMSPSPKRTAEEGPASSEPLRIVVSAFQLDAGNIQFSDQSLSSPFKSTLTDLEITLSRLDTKPGAQATTCRLSARTETDEHLEVKGQAHILPLAVQAEVALKKLAPAKYASYYHSNLNAQIGGGRLDLLAAVQWSDQALNITDISAGITNFTLNDATGRKNLITVPQLNIDGAGIDFKSRRIRMGAISVIGAQAHIQRNDRGQLDLLSVLGSPGSDAAASDPAPAGGSGAAASGWELHAADTKLENGTVTYEDTEPSTPFRIRLHDIALRAEDISNRQQAQGRVNVTLGLAEQGTVSIKGGVGLTPLQADLQVAAEAVDIRPLQPYLQQFVRLVVTKGEFSAQGRLGLAPRDNLPGEPLTGVTFTGKASLSRFEAVDAIKTEPFSKWKSLFLTGIDINTQPLVVKIDEVALTDYFNRLAIAPDGTANIETIMVKQRDGDAPRGRAGEKQPETASAAEGTTSSRGSAADIRIKTVTLQGGRVDFSDDYIKPKVHLVMTELGGRISGLDNIKEDKADVHLRGIVDNNTPLEIKGRVNPLISKPFVDLSLNFPGIDLSPFGPYAGKYLGYRLEKGQLALTLAYKVADNKLAGQNKIQINQLTFGDAVSSNQATKLPIKLAVALLKNREGNIDLDLPVKGDLDDPEFRFGGVILKMFVNLVTEIVSAPFKMLGALFGGGPELAYLGFDPGQAAIDTGGLKKMETLAKILTQRPGLNLEIQGQADRESDVDSLRQRQFENDLKGAKLKLLLAAGRKAVPLDQVEVTPAEREDLIRQSYDNAPFPKPRDDKGQLKKLSPPEMEKLLYTAIAISDDDLRQLAYQRASAAKEYLLANGIQAERLFVTEPVIQSSAAAINTRPQVRFNLNP